MSPCLSAFSAPMKKDYPTGPFNDTTPKRKKPKHSKLSPLPFRLQMKCRSDALFFHGPQFESCVNVTVQAGVVSDDSDDEMTVTDYGSKPFPFANDAEVYLTPRPASKGNLTSPPKLKRGRHRNAVYRTTDRQLPQKLLFPSF